MAEAIKMHFQGLKEDGLPIPVPTAQADYIGVNLQALYGIDSPKWTAQITVGIDRQGKQRMLTLYGKSKKEVLEKLTQALLQQNGGFIEPSKITVEQWLSNG
ncbi:hypothetical protein MTBGP_20610 [Moorella thermoacetica]